jgi:hypothetical protein
MALNWKVLPYIPRYRLACLAPASSFRQVLKHVYFDKSYAEYKGLASDEGVDFLNHFGVKAEKFAG